MPDEPLDGGAAELDGVAALTWSAAQVRQELISIRGLLAP